MPTVQRQNETTAFHPGGSPTDARMSAVPITARAPTPPRRAIPALPPAHPVPSPAVGRRLRAQTAWLVMMFVAALILSAIGLAYLSGPTQVAQEGYRQAKLMAQLQREKEKARQLTQRQAMVNSPADIEKRALEMKMIRPDDGRTVTIP